MNKLDGELGYFESQNEQHKAAQAQLFKANEYEYMQGKDASMKLSESEVNYNKLDQEEKSIGYEIDRLKQHSGQMLKDQTDLQSEIEALNRHMSNLNNQNHCLQKELEEFVQADDAVRMDLDRKIKVDNIRSRVDEVIARSQAEVSRAGMLINPPQVIERATRTFTHEFAPVSEKYGRRQVISYSPMRSEHIVVDRRSPFRPLTGAENIAADIRRQYSFGREPIVGRSSPLRDAIKQHEIIRSKSGGKNVTFAEYPRY